VQLIKLERANDKKYVIKNPVVSGKTLYNINSINVASTNTQTSSIIINMASVNHYKLRLIVYYFFIVFHSSAFESLSFNSCLVGFGVYGFSHDPVNQIFIWNLTSS
jgi:hypothetical protein